MPLSMFGGLDPSKRGVIFVICGPVARIYLKVDDINQLVFEALDAEPFRSQHGSEMTLAHFEVRFEILDGSDRLTIWVGKAWEAARRNADKKALRNWRPHGRS